MPKEEQLDINEIFHNMMTYQYDVFISYSRVEESLAMQLYSSLSQNHLKSFFAPACLDDEELRKQHLWVRPLQDALLHSCNYAILVSTSFLESAWCELELYSFRNCLFRNAKHSMLLFVMESIRDNLPSEFEPFLFKGGFSDFCTAVITMAQNGELSPGDRLDPFPAKALRPLPLREKHGLSAPWKKDSQTPGGHPAGPPYDEYEEIVREIMVKILRGYYPDDAVKVIREWPWKDICIKDAKKDAVYLIELGISPCEGFQV